MREKTDPVLGSCDAKTVEAMSAALVLKLAGMFFIPEFKDV